MSVVVEHHAVRGLPRRTLGDVGDANVTAPLGQLDGHRDIPVGAAAGGRIRDRQRLVGLGVDDRQRLEEVVDACGRHLQRQLVLHERTALEVRHAVAIDDDATERSVRHLDRGLLPHAAGRRNDGERHQGRDRDRVGSLLRHRRARFHPGGLGATS
ncbi:MAG: hypothetical protein IPN32_22150 [Deltaproteobacteria bacterium]|nr:hypothetical protein [Deltaproteobacteria bacterium]